MAERRTARVRVVALLDGGAQRMRGEVVTPDQGPIESRTGLSIAVNRPTTPKRRSRLSTSNPAIEFQ